MKKINDAQLATMFANMRKKYPDVESTRIVRKIAQTYYLDPVEVGRRIARVNAQRETGKPPPPLPSVDSSGYIIAAGRRISSCKSLTAGRTRDGQRWLTIERKSLWAMAKFAQANGDPLEGFFNDEEVTTYFDRTSDALRVAYYSLIKNKK